MHGRLTHFAINADDLPSTQRFYEGVFGWSFEEYMPGFTRTKDAGIDVAAIQARRDLLDVPTNGPEMTFEVDDVDAFVAPPPPLPGGGGGGGGGRPRRRGARRV